MAKKSRRLRPRRSLARKAIGIDEEGRLDEATLRRFVFQTFGRARRTQDSPVMPDVWLRYIRVAEKNGTVRRTEKSIDLLLMPWSGVRPAEIAAQLRDRLKDGAVRTARIALSDSRVVARADFRTLVSHIVPLTGWWQGLFKLQVKKRLREETGKLEELRQEELTRIRKEIFDQTFERIQSNVSDTGWPTRRDIDFEFSRYAALVGFIDRLGETKSAADKRKLAAIAYRLGPLTADGEVAPEEPRELQRKVTHEEKTLMLEIYERARGLLRPGKYEEEPKGIFWINLNRRASQTLFESRATVKADAVHNVFSINTTGITFAVIDGGIDATHPAFLNRSDENAKRLKPDKPSPDYYLKWSRVKETYDFTILRDIVAHAEMLSDPKQLKNLELPEDSNREVIMNLAKDKKHQEAFEHLHIRNKNARDLDWEIVRPLIRVPHDKIPDDTDDDEDGGRRRASNKGRDTAKEYRIPRIEHGTHVAGILAADLDEDLETGRELRGMCPQLSLYDLRVFDADGHGDEFAILCAIEFVGWLNRDRTNPVVHGVNLSLALAHDVDSFACGQTPICEACNHLVGAGTVVVAAAGNTGFEGGPGATRQSLGSGYRTISITDPGNADSVITVGSTHKRDPHLYGVSYFSARGPTGDGRRKPDILAPGEKITSTVPGGGSRRMDGTSMAAPHVAGAAALLMARYPELIGRPARIKEILMRSATDLNREPHFQGAGLVDVLRALQSV